MARKNQQAEENTFLGGDFMGAIVQIAEEKGIEKEKVVETVGAALAAAYKKEYGKKGQNIRAAFDPQRGGVQFFLVKEVVDDTTREFPVEKEDDANVQDGTVDGARTESVPEHIADGEERLQRFNAERDLTIDDARKLKKDAAIGDMMEFPLEAKSDFGRIAAQTAKQVIIQRIREAERDAMFAEYKEKENQVVSGTVQRIEGRTVFVDLGKSVGVLFPSEQIREERYRIGQRLKVYVVKVESDPKGPGITLSRIHPDMVRKLFELEVPEIFAGTVEIKAIAREAGSRSKVAVFSDEEGVDPIGSCVGQKGTRVQSVIDELGGEKVDIIEWNDDVKKFISAALSPAKVLSVQLKEEEQTATVTVPDDQLSLAIGKRGQNVRLAVKLTGWKIDVVGAGGAQQKEETASGEQEAESEEQQQSESGEEKNS